jgi:hypothetical protein
VGGTVLTVFKIPFRNSLSGADKNCEETQQSFGHKLAQASSQVWRWIFVILMSLVIEYQAFITIFLNIRFVKNFTWVKRWGVIQQAYFC